MKPIRISLIHTPLLLVLLWLMGTVHARAQQNVTISGDNVIANGQTKTYQVFTSYSSISWWIEGSGAAIQGSTTGSSIQVQATGFGSFNVRVQLDNYSRVGTKTVNITVPTPDTPTATTANCAVTLSRGTPPSGVTWYWQGTNSSGTSTANSASTYTPSGNGTYYLRARSNGSSGQWSASSASRSVSFPTAPSAPVVSGNASRDICAGQTTTFNISGPTSGWVYDWYQGSIKVKSNSTSFATAPSASTAYTVRVTNTNGCQSAARSLQVNVANVETPEAGNEENNCSSPNSLQLSAISNQKTGLSHVWYTSATGNGVTSKTVSTSNTGQFVSEITVNNGEQTSYWVAEKIGQCEGPRRQVTATFNSFTLNGGGIGNPRTTICTNTDPEAFTSTSSASGGDGSNYTYTWQFASSENGSYTDIANSNAVTYNPNNNLTTARWYRRKVTSCSTTAYSNKVRISLYAAPSGGSINGNQTICYNGNPSTLGSSSSAGGGDPTDRIYQWQYRNTGSSSWNNIGPASASALAYDPPANQTVTRTYRRQVVSCGQAAYSSNQITVTVRPTLSGGTINGDQTVCSGGDPSPLGNVSEASGGDSADRLYQWQYRNEGSSTWNNIGSASTTAFTYNPGNNQTVTRTYRRRVSSCGQNAYSNEITVAIGTPPAAPSVNGGSNTCGNNSVELSATSPSGNGISHIWYTTATGPNTITPEVNEIGSYMTSVTVTLAGNDISYWVSAVQNNCESKRRQVTATYQNNGAVPSLSLQDVSTNTDRCGSGSFILAANITNGGTGHTLDWYEAASGGTAIGSGLSLSINLDQSDMENDGTKTFWVGGTLYNSGGCAYPVQNRQPITVSLDPLPPTPTGNSVDRCGPGTIELTASGNGTLRWYTIATGGTHLAEGSSYSPNIDQDTTFYVEAISPTTGCTSERHPILAQVAQTSTWYLDADGDGHAVSSQQNCGSPGTGWTETVLPIDDCNDNAYSLENDCGTPPVPGGSCNNTPDTTYDSGDRNYIYTRNYQEKRNSVPGTKFLEDNAYIQDIAYFDGLGRPIQNIAIRQSPDSLDIVQHIGYDSYGRKDKEWLPVPLPDTQGALGSYRTLDMAQATREYYKAAYEDDFIGIDVSQTNPYSQQGFERSPLNRVEKQAAPGETWKLGNGHEVEMAYETNEAQEVRKFGVSLNFTNKTYYPTLLDLGVYDEGELSKTVVRDENHDGTTQNHTVEEFKDKQGRVLLKRTYADIDLNADGDTLDNGEQAVAHDTYYVYDDYGNLSYVLPPLMEPHTADLATLLAAMEDVGYQYVYDHRNRVVQKWVPGKKDWDYMVYNNLDQPVMTQDANLRANNEWLFTKYDVHGRVAYTGIAINAETREQAQVYVSGLAGVLWVTRTDQAITVGGATLYYTNDGYPKNTISEVQTISYYDSYDNLNLPAGVPGSITILGSSPAETQSDQVHGLPTLSQVKVLEVDGPNNWIHALTYYDDKGRAVYAYSQNAFLGTVDIVENQLDFTGKPTKVRTTHTRNGATIVTIDNFTYDHTGRLLAQTQCVGDGTLGNVCPGASDNAIPPILDLTGQTVNTPQSATQRIFTTDGVLEAGTQLTLVPGGGNTGDQELIVLNEYDALGQLQVKKVGGEAAATVTNSVGLQQTTHAYNVRGWLTQLNDLTNLGDQLFAFGLKYHDSDVTGKELYNGNISQTFWKTASVQTGTNDISDSYTYTYDALNRITKAEDNTGHYDLDLVQYDKNGNIEQLQRQGHTNVAATEFGLMDDLSYTYSGNQLERVSDLDGATTGFVDGNPGGGTDYTYDQNGNMVSDLNKGITAIEYNHLDLPTKVTINGNGNVGNIVYIYDATGAKLRKIATDTGESSVTHTDYAGNYIYEGNATATTLQFFSQPEGYVKVDNGQYGYVYQYTDHLGNVRLSYTRDPADGGLEIVEENNYYPFGLKHRGYNTLTSALGNDVAQRWKFGGKEYQADMDLAWYDVSARNYDPALGRWMNLDPLAEQMRRHSPYNYAFDNPVFFIDPDGMSPVVGSNGYTDITADEASMYGIHVSGGGGTVDITNLNTGKVVTMSSSDYNEVVMANRSGVTSGNNGGGGSSDGECKTGDCFEAYFRVQAQMIQAELNAMNPVKAVKKGLVDGAKNILSDTWDSVVQQFERAIDDPIGEWQKGFDSSGGVSGIIGGGPYQLYRTLKGSYDFGYNTATTLLNGDPYGAGYAVGNYYSGAALGSVTGLGIGYVGVNFRSAVGQYFYMTSTPKSRLFYQDVTHRSTTFIRKDILLYGKMGIKDYRTVYFNYKVGNKYFSIGINPWKRSIFHEGPGFYK